MRMSAQLSGVMLNLHHTCERNSCEHRLDSIHDCMVNFLDASRFQVSDSEANCLERQRRKLPRKLEQLLSSDQLRVAVVDEENLRNEVNHIQSAENRSVCYLTMLYKPCNFNTTPR